MLGRLAIVCFGELPFHIPKSEPLPCTTCMRISNSQCRADRLDFTSGVGEGRRHAICTWNRVVTTRTRTGGQRLSPRAALQEGKQTTRSDHPIKEAVGCV